MLVTDSLIGDFVTLCITLTVLVIGFYKWSFQYWRKKNLPYLEPQIPFGNFVLFRDRKKHVSEKVKSMYDTMKKKGWKHGGGYNLFSPFYLLIDLDYVKNIMTKDFEYFSDRGFYYNEKADPLSAHLVNIGGIKWRNLRTKLTPTFTPGKMKTMFQTLLDCESNLLKRIELDNERIDIKEVVGNFTTDIIGSCAFGLDCKSFEEENSPFRVFGQKFFQRSLQRVLLNSFADTFPQVGLMLNIRANPADVSDFFMKTVKNTVKHRKVNNIIRKDFMQSLIDLKNNKEDENGCKNNGTSLTIEEIAAQSFVFFIAGFETSSTTMTFVLYELAKHQDLQDRVRDEIRTVLANYDDKITYDAIQDLKYMNQVIDEAFRKYPPVAVIPRRCVKDYKIPNTDIIIDKGTSVLISVLGIHHDPEHYPDPEKFDPERFTEENKNSRHSYAHIPFGEGPRICIGMRFGMMQLKVGLTSLLKNFKFTVNGKTKEPITFNPYSLILTTKGGIWLDAHTII